MSGIVGSRLNIRGSGLVGSLGTDGQVFTSSGAGAGAVYETAAGGGKIVQVTTGTSTTQTTVTATSHTATSLSGAITPTDDGNKILVDVDCSYSTYDNSGNCCRADVTVYRDIGGAGFSESILNGGINTGYCKTDSAGEEVSEFGQFHAVFLDSPATTSEVTYKLYTSVSSSLNIQMPYAPQLNTIVMMETDES